MTRSTLQAAATRAVRTFIQVLIPALGAGAVTELDYIGGASLAAGAAILSLLQGLLRGLPEADEYAVMDDYADPVVDDTATR